jgi:hypothetical protein
MEVVVSIFWQFYADDTAAAVFSVCANADDERSSTGQENHEATASLHPIPMRSYVDAVVPIPSQPRP